MFTVSAFLIIPQTLGNLSINLLQRDFNMKGIQIIHVFSYVCFGAAAIPLAMNGWNGWSLVIAYAIQTFIKLIASYSICRHTLRPRLRGDSELIKFGLKSLVNDVVNWSMDHLDRVLIGRLWGLYSLGLYSVAFNLSKAPSGLLVYAVQNITFSSASRLQGDVAALRKGFQIIFSAMALASLPLFTMVAYESMTVLHVVYGVKWLKAAPYMTALAMAIPFISLGSITAAILRGAGAVGIELRIQIITAIFFFACLIFLREWSLANVIWTVPSVYFVRLVLLLLAINKNIGINLREIIASLRGTIVLTFTGISVAVLVHVIPNIETIALGILPLMAGCIACVMLFILRFNWFLGPQLVTVIGSKVTNGYLGRIVGFLQRRGL
jgi:O-antigen/teichoic acid export membrane protein